MVHADLHDDRRLTAKGRATRDRIVKVAAELILSDGLSALNMDALRKAASVSGSQLAHYFTDIAVKALEIGNMSSPQAVEKSGAPQGQRIGAAVERLLVVGQQGFEFHALLAEGAGGRSEYPLNHGR